MSLNDWWLGAKARWIARVYDHLLGRTFESIDYDINVGDFVVYKEDRDAEFFGKMKVVSLNYAYRIYAVELEAQGGVMLTLMWNVKKVNMRGG